MYNNNYTNIDDFVCTSVFSQTSRDNLYPSSRRTVVAYNLAMPKSLAVIGLILLSRCSGLFLGRR